MNIINKQEISKAKAILKVADFLKIADYNINDDTIAEQIKRLCVLRLMKAVGVSGRFNCKSEFFEFFSSAMGEAICEKLGINVEIAPDKLRLIKYENINFVIAFEEFLNNDLLDEAFLDAFALADKYKHLIPEIMA